jgi:hypothetical protein
MVAPVSVDVREEGQAAFAALVKTLVRPLESTPSTWRTAAPQT